MKLMATIFNKQNVFLFLLIVMVLLAKLIPFHESYNQYFNLAGFIDWGIAGIFLLYGLKLNLKEVVKDISNWKLHLLIQSGTFIVFPLLVLLFYPLVKDSEYYNIWLSIFFSGMFALHGFIIGSHGFYCKRKCNFSYFQCFHFRTDRYHYDTTSHEFLFDLRFFIRRSVRNHSAAFTESFAPDYPGRSAESFFEKMGYKIF